MLKNDPPKQTLLRFLKSVEQAKRGEQATLIGPVKTYHVDRPDDLFTVHYRGRNITVRRDEIEEA